MIEVVLDGNNNDEFDGEKYPLIVIEKQKQYEWDNYKKLASEIIEKNKAEANVIIRINDDGFSLNKMALAMFVASLECENKIECAVFKVCDLQEAREKYKPFVALTIAVKYIVRLAAGSREQAYRDIAGLGYLGIDISRNYTKNVLKLEYLAGGDDVLDIVADSLSDAIVETALIKALSLAKIKAAVRLKINIKNESEAVVVRNLIEKLLQMIKPWID